MPHKLAKPTEPTKKPKQNKTKQIKSQSNRRKMIIMGALVNGKLPITV